MFDPVSPKVSLPALEERILALWRDRDIFRRSVAARAGGPHYAFYEGPPTANGSPGIHHVLARVFKDVVLRYWSMRGYHVPRKGGWDTHGLPVELEVEKELGISSKPQIEQFGIDRFNQRCRESVFRYVKEWETMTERIAFWVDMEDPYITFTNDYIESCWWILKQLWDRGLIYQDYRVTPHCPRCGTSLSDHEVALGYKDDIDDPSVYIRFRLDEASTQRLLGDEPGGPAGWEAMARPSEPALSPPKGRQPAEPVDLLAWTTTPWTLPGNVAVAVDPNAPYVLVRQEDPPARLVLDEALVAGALVGPFTIERTVMGRDLVGLHYEPLYRSEAADGAYRVVAGEFVSHDEGTGIVHMAPAYGEVDLEVGRREGLPLVQTVDLRGQVAGDLPGAGLFVKEADPLIEQDLQRRGLLYRSGRIRHTYPFCWRCDTPLLYYAKTSWYIRTSARKDALLRGNRQINWYPAYIKEGRFGDWLANNVDWAISRERYWGTPLNIWRCQGCATYDCVGSLAELEERAGQPGLASTLDLHRPYVDEVVLPCPSCSQAMRRVPEVVDCWFDSGAMPVAQWHYPFENRDRFDKSFPADYICEAVDQTRGWFYSLHAISILLFDQPCYRHVICLGHILDSKGEKMSKSRGNVVDPWSVLNRHGADAVRWYLFTATPAGNPRRFSADLVGEAVRRFLLTLWNTYSFFVTYARIDGYTPDLRTLADGRAVEPQRPVLRQAQDERGRSEGASHHPSTHPLDRWALARLHQTVRQVTQAMETYDPTSAGRQLQAFVDDLSNWYVRRSRRRFWKSENDADKASAYDTLYQCLETTARLLAPLCPFVAEELYQNLVRSADPAAPESVHMADWPQADDTLVEPAILESTALAQRLAALGRAARSKAGVKVRQPLTSALVMLREGNEAGLLAEVLPQVAEELNVKEVRLLDDEASVLTYTIRPDLARLGPRLGSRLPAATAALQRADPAAVARWVAAGQPVELGEVTLQPDEVLVSASDAAGHASAAEGGYRVALDLSLTTELRDEGMVRELVHRLQGTRRTAGLDIADQIVTYYQAPAEIGRVLEAHQAYVRQETLSTRLVAALPPDGAFAELHQVDGHEVLFAVQRV